MTLIVSAATHRLALQVADTRLTNPKTKEIIRDDAYKIVVVHCNDADASIAFSGTAFIGATKVDEWLIERLAGAPKSMSFGDLVIFAERELNALRKRSLNFQWHGRLQLAFSGVARTLTGAHLPALAHISNIDTPTKQALGEEPPGAQRHRFQAHDHVLGKPAPAFEAVIGRGVTRGFLMTGSIDWTKPLKQMSKNLERKLMQASGPAEGRTLLDELVNFIRGMRRSGAFAKVIGESYVGVVIDISGQIDCLYYGPSEVHSHAPLLADKRGRRDPAFLG